MPVSPAQRKATAKYNAQNYDRVELRLPRGRKAIVEEAAKKELTSDGKEGSLNGLINRLLREYLGFSEAEWKSPNHTTPESN